MNFDMLVVFAMYAAISGVVAVPLVIFLNYALYPAIIAAQVSWLQVWALLVATVIAGTLRDRTWR